MSANERHKYNLLPSIADRQAGKRAGSQAGRQASILYLTILDYDRQSFQMISGIDNC